MAVQARIGRYLHPGAWWVWALGLAIAASRTTNPLILGLIIAVLALVVAARRPDAPWSRSFVVLLRLGLVVIAIRLVFQVLLGSPIGTTVVVTLPTVPLPSWAAGLRLGGPITLESIVFAACDGLRLAVLLACVGAANSLASPSRLLKAMPAALYEVGVAVVVAMTFAPQLVSDITRVRRAQRLRGRPDRGVRGLVGSAMPVFDGALDRAVTLAAAMDSRGYGRSAPIAPKRRIADAAMLLGGLVGICIGLFGVLDSSASGTTGLIILAIGVVIACVGIWRAGARSVRTRYRPDPWLWPEWAVCACGVAAAAAVFATGQIDPEALLMPVTPLAMPVVPPLALLGLCLAALPATLSPPLPIPRTLDRQHRQLAQEVPA